MAKMRLPNGYGNISKLSGKRRNPWRVRINNGFTEEGKVKWLNIGYFRTHTEAKKALDAFHNDPLARTEKITVGEIYEILQKKVLPNKSESTRLNYNSAYNKYVGEIANKAIIDLKLDDLEYLFEYRTEATQKMMKNVVSMIYNYAMKREYIVKNYSQLIELSEIPSVKSKKQERREYTKEELERVWNDYKNGVEEAKYVLVYLHTGMRRDELSRTTILNDKHMIVDGKKNENAKMRKVPIHDVLKPFIHDLDFQIDTQTIFNYVSSFGQILHNCRHSFITQSRRIFLSETHVDTMTGHENKSVKDRYTHFNFEDLEPIMKAFHYPTFK